MAQYESDRYPSFVFVQTDFVRNGAPIFACAVLEPRRRIKLPWEVCGLPVDEQVKIAQQLSEQHYRVNAGRVEFWGNIQGYLFQFSEEQPPITMTTTGQIVAQAGGVPPAATLSVGNRIIFPRGQ